MKIEVSENNSKKSIERVEDISEWVQLTAKNQNSKLSVGEVCQHVDKNEWKQIARNFS